MIDENLLLEYGATIKKVAKDEILFNKGEHAYFYYQIISGEIKMNNYNLEGKEFTQGIFYAGQSFGEPPLFVDVEYPASAEAVKESKIYKLTKDKFYKLLKENPDMHFKITEVLSGRLYYKAIMASEISSRSPDHRILKLIDYLKIHVNQLEEKEKYAIDLTRQQIADLTGLRVETVIRSCKALEKQGEIEIKNRKIIR